MKNNKLKLLFLIIIFCIIIKIYFLFQKLKLKNHNFWNNSQPIIINKKSIKNEGIIKELNDLHILHLPSNINKIIFNQNNINTFIDFVNNHFEDKAIISLSYINWHLINSINNKLIYGLFENELNGVIAGNIISLNISNKIYKTIYVDYLCISKKYRSQNLAPLLISCIIDFMKKNKCYISLFKSDSNKHHFKHFYETNYYILDLRQYYKKNNLLKNNSIFKLYNSLTNNITLTTENPNINIQILTNRNDITILYNIYTSYCKNYNIYEILDKKIFYNKLLNNIVNVYLFIIKDEIVGYIILTKLYYPNIKDYIYDIYHLFLDNKYLNNEKFLNQLTQFFIDKNILYISTLLNNNTTLLIKNLNMKKGIKSYYYLYNYNINLSPNKILLFK